MKEPQLGSDVKVECENEEYKITTERVVALMIKSLGPIPAFELIKSSLHSQFVDDFSPVVYGHFIRAVDVDMQQRELAYWMLKRILEDLWLDNKTKRPPTIAPQFRAVKEMELNMQLDQVPFLDRLGHSQLAPLLRARENLVHNAPPVLNHTKYEIGYVADGP